jgi:hypothetical protein
MHRSGLFLLFLALAASGCDLNPEGPAVPQAASTPTESTSTKLSPELKKGRSPARRDQVTPNASPNTAGMTVSP